MNLDENQKQQVARWLDQGLKLAEVQNKLHEELGINLTYMELKFLVSDLNLKPKDPEPEQPPPPVAAGPLAGGAAAEAGEAWEAGEPEDESELPGPGVGGVKVAVDQLARPGAMISGKVTFSNGKTCEWMLDQMGRLGVVPAADGFKPGGMDLQEFQVALQRELQKMGY